MSVLFFKNSRKLRGSVVFINLNLKKELSTLIFEIQKMSEAFYQQKKEEGFSKLDPVIVSLMQILDKIFVYEFEDSSIETDKIEINSILEKAMNAIALKDTVLVADIFSHELIPILDKMKESL